MSGLFKLLLVGVLVVIGINMFHRANPCFSDGGVSPFSGMGGYTGRVLCSDGVFVVIDPDRWRQVNGQ
jgi:hypothetical protein